MDFLGYVFQALGSAIGGVLQVLTDFINLVIDVVPNPDPFEGIVEELPDSVIFDMGYPYYWLDAFVGVDFAAGVLGAWAALMVATSVFAVIYWVFKSVKP